ncbi:MAG: hypothetical protein KC613_13945 [Myxococcales bacterium]|nr:hypothetical protein [Myxococcales bacterium]MCB9523947.1 hypothetical protein [Myxococcales bacterium]
MRSIRARRHSGFAVATLLSLGVAWAGPPATVQSSAGPTPKEQTVTRIHLIAGAQTFTAVLDDTRAARDFARLLPLDLTLSDYAGTEKVADLPRRLSTEGAPAAYAAAAGDLTYYAPWGNLAVFYKPFRSASGLVRLGHIQGGHVASLEGRVRVERVAAPR